MTSRLDQVLVARGWCASREQAQRVILAGQVRLNGQIAAKPGRRVREPDRVEMVAPPRYVGRGGEKLEHALQHFAVPVTGARVADLGASTGGFTDCLLQFGADRVYAVDVGRGQLAWTLRQHPKVVVMEQTNARHLTPDSFPAPFEPLDGAVIDCSFISLRLILPAAARLVRSGGWILALVKPQFEAGKREADRGGGVITDPAVHDRVLTELRAWVDSTSGLAWQGLTASPLRGPAGNREFFVYLQQRG